MEHASFTRWLRYPQVLNGLGLLPSGDTLVMSVNGDRVVRIPIRPTGNDYGRFIGKPSWIQAVSGPLYLKDRDKAYWYTFLPNKTLYFQFNSVRNSGSEPLDIFIQRMFESLDSAKAEKMIVDMRWNYGGNTALLTPLLRAVMGRPQLVRRGNLFVIIGRITNSAAQNAVTLLERYTNPITVGEITASSPNFTGEDNFITLPYSKIAVGISDLYWQTSWPQDERIWTAPLIYAPPTWELYKAGRDPAMEAIAQFTGR